MLIYAQHGHGKSDKIEKGIQDKSLSGVILRPQNEKPDSLASFVNELRDQFKDDVEILIDPQFYLANRLGAKDGHLPSYPYYSSGLKLADFIAPSDVRSYVQRAIDFQVDLNVSKLLSPTVYVSDFNDRWYHLSLQMAQESLAITAGMNNTKPLMISIVLDEGALRDKQALDEFLDIISLWEVHGFYLIVSLTPQSYPADLQPDTLSAIMYVVYVLSSVHHFEVVCGYSDLVSLPLHAVGCKATSTGWYHTLRQFSISKFQPSTGGRRPVPRYTSAPLINTVKIAPELEAIKDSDSLKRVLSGTTYDRLLGGNLLDVWDPSTSCLHHWSALSKLATVVSSGNTVTENLSNLRTCLSKANDLYSNLKEHNVQFEPASGPRYIDSWIEAIAVFQARVELDDD